MAIQLSKETILKEMNALVFEKDEVQVILLSPFLGISESKAINTAIEALQAGQYKPE